MNEVYKHKWFVSMEYLNDFIHDLEDGKKLDSDFGIINIQVCSRGANIFHLIYWEIEK